MTKSTEDPTEKSVHQTDAVVLSNWTFESNGSPERAAVALVRAGGKVIYARNPRSIISRCSDPSRLHGTVSFLEPKFVGMSAARFRLLGHWQQDLLAAQFRYAANRNGLQKPAFLYHDLSTFDGWRLLRLLKRHGWLLVHLNLDATDHPRNAAEADLILSIPEATFESYRHEYGYRVIRQRQFGPLEAGDASLSFADVSELLASIPRPRIFYAGRPSTRLAIETVREVLRRHPEWSFVFCGDAPDLQEANAYPLPWLSTAQLNGVLREVDAGFTPYNCHDEMQLHCVPLKYFDYLIHGLPVVTTPIRHASELGDLVYSGATADQLCAAIQAAIQESSSDPRRLRRTLYARSHDLTTLGIELSNQIAAARRRIHALSP